MKKPKREKRVTYSMAHNKAVKMYQKSSIFLLWAGVVNLLAIVIGVIQISANTMTTDVPFNWPTSGFAMCFSFQIILNSIMIQSLNQVVADILIIITGVVFGGIFALIGFLASRGHRKLLLIGGSLYALDFISMFFVYESGNVSRNWTNYSFTLVTHIVILVACVIAVVEYYNVIHIEKIFKGVKDVKIEEDVESEVIARGDGDK